MTQRRLIALFIVLGLCASACGDDTGAGAQTPDPTTSAPADTTTSHGAQEAETPATTTDPVPDLGAVVVLAEELLLADVLALGVRPIASSASVPEAGFQGLDDFDTDGIEILGMTTLSLERLAALRPDTIITLQFWLDQVGADIIEGIAERVIAIPDNLASAPRITELGRALRREDAADALIGDLENAIAAARPSVPDDCRVSVVALYPGPSVAAFVEPNWEMPRTITELGCSLVPGSAETDPDANGRAFLSLEQLGLLAGDEIFLLQNDTVSGDSEAVDAITAGTLWQQLPAVETGQVSELDRLGYPGIAGQIRFAATVADLLAN